ncbi:MAG: folate-binding protein [Thiotrichaceae bacterium]
MLQPWKQLLIDTGAEFVDDKLVSFGNPESERKIPPQGDMICDLSHLGLIRVQGEDATDFLQNQLTNDIKLVTASKAQLSAWCNPKGRTIATFIIHKNQDAYYLSLSADLMEYVLKRLQMYVMRAKVELTDVTETIVHFGFSGAHILEDWDAGSDGELASDDYGVAKAGNLSIIKTPGVEPRYEVVGEFEEASKLWQKINAHAEPVSGEAWNYLNIAAGLPVVAKASQEVWIPQMLNLQIIDGVNFQKGCFPGQEIVARLKYLGKNKRRAFRLEIATDQVPEIGELIIAEGESAEAGKVLNAVLNPAGSVEVLAVLKIAMADKPLFLATTDGASAKVLELPFSVDEE